MQQANPFIQIILSCPISAFLLGHLRRKNAQGKLVRLDNLQCIPCILKGRGDAVYVALIDKQLFRRVLWLHRCRQLEMDQFGHSEGPFSPSDPRSTWHVACERMTDQLAVSVLRDVRQLCDSCVERREYQCLLCTWSRKDRLSNLYSRLCLSFQSVLICFLNL